MLSGRKIIGLLALVTLAAVCQAQGGFTPRGQNKATPPEAVEPKPPNAAEDISGMYSFLKDGEFLQINLERTQVTGYISRQGEAETDREVFLDQFFSRADVQGHDVSFATKPLHSVWYEFKGRFDRGPAKTKADDGYYILRGTLKEYAINGDKSTLTRSRDVEFKLLGQPDDSDDAAPAKGKKPKN